MPSSSHHTTERNRAGRVRRGAPVVIALAVLTCAIVALSVFARDRVPPEQRDQAAVDSPISALDRQDSEATSEVVLSPEVDPIGGLMQTIRDGNRDDLTSLATGRLLHSDLDQAARILEQLDHDELRPLRRGKDWVMALAPGKAVLRFVRSEDDNQWFIEHVRRIQR